MNIYATVEMHDIRQAALHALDLEDAHGTQPPWRCHQGFSSCLGRSVRGMLLLRGSNLLLKLMKSCWRLVSRVAYEPREPV